MDGFHYPRSYLDNMLDPKEAYKRRGAPWTFDAVAFIDILKKIHEMNEVMAPSFDHKIGDPIEKDIHIKPETKVVVVEGNYLLLNEEPWAAISKLLAEKWFIDIPIEEAMERVRIRHIGTGLTNDQAIYRIDTNDRPNAIQIIQQQVLPDKILYSKHDPHFLSP